MVDKYLKQSSGNIAEQEGLVTSGGAGDAGKIPALDPTGRLDPTLMPVGIVPETKLILASEALSASNVVNVWNDGGAWKVRKADATTSGKEVNGFVLEACDQGVEARIYFEGNITGLDGLTPSTYFLSTTAGAITATPPSSSGNIVQKVGKAISATELHFEPQDFIVLA